MNWVECEYLLNIRICRCYQDLRLSVKKIFGLFLLRELQMNKTPSILNCIYYCNNNKICRSAFNTHSFLRNHKLGRYLIKLLRMDPVQNITHSILSSSKLCKSNNITTSGFLGFLFNFATYSINFQQMFTHFPDSLLHIYVHIIWQLFCWRSFETNHAFRVAKWKISYLWNSFYSVSRWSSPIGQNVSA